MTAGQGAPAHPLSLHSDLGGSSHDDLGEETAWLNTIPIENLARLPDIDWQVPFMSKLHGCQGRRALQEARACRPEKFYDPSPSEYMMPARTAQGSQMAQGSQRTQAPAHWRRPSSNGELPCHASHQQHVYSVCRLPLLQHQACRTPQQLQQLRLWSMRSGLVPASVKVVPTQAG